MPLIAVVDINAAYAVTVAIQGAGELVYVAAYRRPAVCRSGGFPAFPVFDVVQHDVGSQFAASGCVFRHAIRTVYYGSKACQLRSVGNLVGLFRRTATSCKGCGYGAVPYFSYLISPSRCLPVEPQLGEQAVFAARAKSQRQHSQKQRSENVTSSFHTI